MGLTRRLLSLTLSVLLLVAVGSIPGSADSLSVHATRQSAPIRIGYLPGYGTLSELSQEGRKGYGYDLFAQIALDTRWQYDYIPCDWEQGLAMLESGAIDIFGPMQTTPERQEQFLFPQRPFGYEFGVLYALSDADIYYDDLNFFDGMQVGVFPGSYYTTRLEDYCDRNNITVKTVQANEADCLAELQDGRYDTFVAGSLFDVPNTRVVAKVSTEEFYYAVNPNRLDLLTELDRAMENIYQNDPYYYSKLHDKYYKEKLIASPSFTKEEREFASVYPEKLRVAVEADTPPIQYQNEVTGQAEGISVGLIRAIGEKCGLEFEFVPINRDQETLPENIDIAASFMGKRRLVGQSHTSLPYHQAPMVFVSNRNQLPQDARTIAMVESESMTADAVLAKYPQFTLLPYQNMEQVLSSLSSAAADIALVSLYAYDDMVRANPTGGLTAFPTGLELVMNLEVSDRLPGELVNIINKGITQLSQAEVSSIVFANTSNRTRPPSFTDLMQSHALAIIFVASVVILVMLLLIITTVTSSRGKRRVLLESAQALQDAAYLDALTGISTPLKFRHDAELLLQNAKPNEYILATLDVNHFKYVNDILGYNTGNQILQLLAQQFSQQMQPGSLISRSYADNFAFLYRTELHNEASDSPMAVTALHDALTPLLGSNYQMQFSVGLYRILNPTLSLSFMLDCANIAKKSAKGLYSTSIVEYTEEMDVQVRTNREITLGMENALRSGEFVPYLQPKIRLDTESLCGAEMLVRWIHPERGMVQPMDFIPLFEKNGFIGRLDLYMFEQTCQLLRRWLDEGRTTLPRISVNVSNITLANAGFVDHILSIAQQYSLDPAMIEVEMTESALANSADAMMDIMSHLKDVGFYVSIDDFGSGYSSFSLLKDVRADVLKIDKGFLSETLNTEKGNEIIRCIISLSQRLQLETVAEGVETRAQADSLREMGCDIAQGYYYARPMPCEEFEALMAPPNDTI